MNKQHKEIADFYNNCYYAGKNGSARLSRHLSRLAKKIRISPNDKVLDVACGSGEWLGVCTSLGAKPFGIDISSKAIELCQQSFPEGDFRCGPAETLPYPDNSFDVVTCLGSLEHFLDQNHALAEMTRVAKPDARILILVPNSGFLTYRMGIYSGTNQQAARETIRSLSEWGKMISGSGLSVQARWKDLHVLSRAWIFRKPLTAIPARLLQAISLALWPLNWQYQVYHLCSVRTQRQSN